MMIAQNLAAITAALSLASPSAAAKPTLRRPEVNAIIASDAEEGANHHRGPHDNQGTKIDVGIKVKAHEQATFTLPPGCIEHNKLRARVDVPTALSDLLPSQNHGTGCPLTYRLVDSNGSTLAEDTTYHRILRLNQFSIEWTEWMEVGVADVAALEIEIGCSIFNDALLLESIELQCLVKENLVMDDYEIVEEWGEHVPWSLQKGYCLSTDPSDLEGWEDKVYQQACPNKYCFNADSSAQPCPTEN